MLRKPAFQIITVPNIIGTVRTAQDVGMERHRHDPWHVGQGFDKLSLSGVVKGWCSRGLSGCMPKLNRVLDKAPTFESVRKSFP